MANIFKEAKKIQRAHPRMDWQQCIQQASKKHRGRKKVGAVKKKSSSRQTGSSSKAYDIMRTARPPGARKPAGSNKVTYYERRKNRSDKPGQLTGIGSATAAQLKAALRSRLVEKESKLVLQKYRATRKTDKRSIGKQITAVKSELRKLI